MLLSGIPSMKYTITPVSSLFLSILCPSCYHSVCLTRRLNETPVYHIKPQFAMNAAPDFNPAPVFEIQEDRSSPIVLACGLATTAIALLGVYILDASSHDFHIMGWYADYVLPIGAVAVGFVAAAGYGLASWFSGVKITRRLLWAVLVLQLAAYFVAQYIEFSSLKLIHRDGTPVGFLEYYDFMARSFAWQQRNGAAGAPLGLWGYAFRGLEVLGFLGGSMIVPLLLRNKPYCQPCRRYMRTRALIVWAASVPSRKIKKSYPAALESYEAEQIQADENGRKVWTALKEAASASKASEFQEMILSLQPQKKAAAKLPQRLILKLVHCRRCCSGRLQLDLIAGQGRELKQTELEQVPLQNEFVRKAVEWTQNH
jgi:hypothetical protein